MFLFAPANIKEISLLVAWEMLCLERFCVIQKSIAGQIFLVFCKKKVCLVGWFGLLRFCLFVCYFCLFCLFSSCPKYIFWMVQKMYKEFNAANDRCSWSLYK